jgi:hypothetical protein
VVVVVICCKGVIAIANLHASPEVHDACMQVHKRYLIRPGVYHFSLALQASIDIVDVNGAIAGAWGL